MLTIETIYGNFGLFWTLVLGAFAIKGIFRAKRFVRLPLWAMLFIIVCIPIFTAFLYLFAILEISALSGKTIYAILGPKR